MIAEHIGMLGRRATDRVTRFEGVVTCVSFDLYGCLQAVVAPESKEGKMLESHWFDAKRLELGELVMPPPKFDPEADVVDGPAEKPPAPAWPAR